MPATDLSDAPLNPAPSPYIGRFAPSPTGPLHFGSLMAALASYFDARLNSGQWLVRMEDLDPPREVKGSADDILRTIECFGLEWDGEVMFQSQRHDDYQQQIEQLLNQQLAYRCQCSRQQIAERGPVYDGYCRTRQSSIKSPYAIRVVTDNQTIAVQDRIQGSQQQQLQQQCGDFVIRRKDNLFAYQLAVVCDDAEQKITHIVRGSDLLDSTPRQCYLQKLLGFTQPCYAHIPIMVNEQGQKLSKQTYATALDKSHPEIATFQAMQVLGLKVPTTLSGAPVSELLQWGIQHWNLDVVPKQLTVPKIEL